MVEEAEYVTIALVPVVGLDGAFPVFAGTADIGGVIRVERAVTPVVDLEAEAGKARITDPGIVDLKSGPDQLLKPVAMERRKGVGRNRNGIGGYIILRAAE